MTSIALLFKYLKILGERIADDDIKQSALLHYLYNWVPETNKTITANDIEPMLNDLAHIANLNECIMVNDELAQLYGKLIRTVFIEIREIVLKNPSMLNEALRKRLIKANPGLFPALYDYLIGNDSANVECTSPSMTVGKSKDNKTIYKVFRIALRWMLHFGSLPALDWYYDNPILQPYRTKEALINLAYVDEAAFQEIQYLFPGLIYYHIASYEDLKTFCQLMPRTFFQILMNPMIQKYLSTNSDIARIIESIPGVDVDNRIDIVKLLLADIYDLIELVNHNSSYALLLVEEKVDEATKKIVVDESVCSRMIKSIEDILMFDLSNSYIHIIISRNPRLRALIGSDSRYIEHTKNSLYQPRRMREIRNNMNSLLNSFANNLRAVNQSILDPRLLTLGQVVALTQFHENAGYYTNGSVSIGNSDDEGHFITAASSGYGLAIALSHRAKEIWQQLPEARQQHFELLECGAGDGSLCYKMFEFIEQMARIYPKWERFYQALHYTIVEISPVLIEKQQQKMAATKHNQKVEFILDDALKLTRYQRIADLHISNELMDMLESQEIYKDEDELVQVTMAIPILTEQAYQYLLTNDAEAVCGLPEEANEFDSYLQRHTRLEYPGYPITAQRFKTLMVATNKPSYKGPAHCFNFSELLLPIYYFPELMHFLEDHDEIFTNMGVGDKKIVSPKLETYAKLITEKSMVSIMVDYGDVSFYLKNRGYRSYCTAEQFKNMYLYAPGKQDVTYCVDFSVLVESIIKYAPDAFPIVAYMGALLPKLPKMPLSHMSQFSLESENKFRNSNYVFAMYTAPTCSIKFFDIQKKSVKVARQVQYFAEIEDIAQKNTMLSK